MGYRKASQVVAKYRVAIISDCRNRLAIYFFYFFDLEMGFEFGGGKKLFYMRFLCGIKNITLWKL